MRGHRHLFWRVEHKKATLLSIAYQINYRALSLECYHRKKVRTLPHRKHL
ncbi:Uncharacterised protein [Vibrio cholerae]|nr:Uncharacterised protein [Vibrio cholerae]